MNNITICKRCVIDSTVPGAIFDENGICNHCYQFEELDQKFRNKNDREQVLQSIITKIKLDGKNKKYDCVLGVSGGQDSSYTLLMAKNFGLRPLAVHFDNGWNSKISVENINKILKKLDVDLYTYVVDWEEFKDIQLSFLKASVPDAEIPTDIAIKSVLYKAATDNKVKYILYSGSNYRTEGSMPKDWTYMDGRYVCSVQKKFGTKKLKSFPNYTMSKIIYFHLFKKLQVIRLLEYIAFNNNDVLSTLKNELDWEYYGGKHYESVYTKFFQSYLLPVKFGIDKRKVHFSALIRSGQATRKKMLEKLKELPYDIDKIEFEKEYIYKKFNISKKDFEIILRLPIKSYQNYKTYDSFKQKILPIIQILKKKELWPRIA